MDFFERQDQARAKTHVLVGYFILSVLFIILAVYLLAWAVYGGFLIKGDKGWPPVWMPQLFLGATGITLVIVTFGSLSQMWSLRSGGAAVAGMLGGRPVDLNTDDPAERRFINVVEEMAIASGTPVPQLFVLDQEPGINAFAAGHRLEDAAIGVNRGTLDHLTRDELQGVIAHEFSHILHGDMALNLRLIGILHGILCIAMLGRILMENLHFRVGSRDRNGGNAGLALVVFGIGLMAIGGIGMFFAKLIKSAISRQREHLADASAVQFTRNPEGLAGALKKIGGLVMGSQMQSPLAEEASHLFFGNGLRASFLNAFATHPPLVERIQALDPQFDGKFTPIESRSKSGNSQKTVQEATGQLSGLASSQEVFPNAQGSTTTKGISAAALQEQMGTPTRVHLVQAEQLLRSMPDGLREASHQTLPACAIVYGLLLHWEDETLLDSQLQWLREHALPEVYLELECLRTTLSGLQRAQRLPLLELSLPALKAMSPAQYERFRRNVHELVETDAQIDLFEYALLKILTRHLDPLLGETPRRRVQHYSLQRLSSPLAVLFAALAHAGQRDPEKAARAFSLGWNAMNLGSTPGMPSRQEAGLQALDTSLEQLSEVSLPLLRKVLHGLACTAAADGIIQIREAEMLRAIGETLHCPIPPLVEVPMPSTSEV